MVRYIETKGRKLAVAFSLRKVFALCSRHNTDLEGLIAELSKGKIDEPTYEILLELGELGLTTGAERLKSGETFTLDDVDTLYTEDLSVLKNIVAAFYESVQGEQVFPTAATTQKPPKKKGAR